MDRSALTCDACDFEDAVAAGVRERCLEVYGGDLLPGLYLRGTGNSLNWLVPMLRQEARLVAAVGDRKAALAAYRSYLSVRADPEPRLRPQLDSVRAEYRRLRPTGG